MAKILIVRDELTLRLSFWERLGALHASPRVLISDIAKIEYVETLWSKDVLRGVRAPGTAVPYVVLLGTMRGRNYRDFTAIKGRGAGVIITLKSGHFARWIFTLCQPKGDLDQLNIG